RPLRRVLVLLIQNQSNRSLSYLSRVLARSAHDSILSRKGASEKPGAIHPSIGPVFCTCATALPWWALARACRRDRERRKHHERSAVSHGAPQGSACLGSVRKLSSVRLSRNARRSARSSFVSVKPGMKPLLSGFSAPSPAYGPSSSRRPPRS